MVIEIRKIKQQAQTNKQTNKTKSKHQNKLIYNHHSASYFSSFNNRPITYQRRVITKLPNSEQSYKGKVKTHKYINRQNQSTTGKLWNIKMKHRNSNHKEILTKDVIFSQWTFNAYMDLMTLIPNRYSKIVTLNWQ